MISSGVPLLFPLQAEMWHTSGWNYSDKFKPAVIVRARGYAE
jgi:hypothetical protein